MPELPLLQVNQLRLGYAGKSVLKLDALTLQQGEELAVIGPSGCGKTSLLHLIAGLQQPTAGEIKILGTSWASLRPAARDRYRGQHIGIIFQRLHLLPALSVLKNLTLSQKLSRMPVDPQAIFECLDRLGIAHLAHAKPSALSVGQAQRVAIARALVHKPALILADEPTSSLDNANADRAICSLRQHAAELGASLLVVTHDQRVRGTFKRELDLGALS